VCRHDLARAVVAALAWSGRGYEALNVVGSRSARARFDIARTEAVLGIALETDFAGD